MTNKQRDSVSDMLLKYSDELKAYKRTFRGRVERSRLGFLIPVRRHKIPAYVMLIERARNILAEELVRRKRARSGANFRNS